MQVAILLTIYLCSFDTPVFRPLLTRRFALRALLLACLWFGVEELGLALHIWYYPREGTLGFRIFRLPLEEYLMFFTHAALCQMLLTHALRRPRR
jgi:lycopene cyclase domain-containing protein